MTDRYLYLSKLIEFITGLTASKFGFIFRYERLSQSVNDTDTMMVRNKIQGIHDSINVEKAMDVLKLIINEMICIGSFKDSQETHNGEIKNKRWVEAINPTWEHKRIYFSIFPVRYKNEIIAFLVLLRDFRYDHFINQNTLFPLLLKIAHDLQKIDLNYTSNSGATIC